MMRLSKILWMLKIEVELWSVRSVRSLKTIPKDRLRESSSDLEIMNELRVRNTGNATSSSLVLPTYKP